ncbi:uncharacterized protein HHUB_1675 [Halobacterium hubeiense]|uniref:Uncharacterized protein n=1 Tax=Halobacterium hubeiense TaxID=1407499 RepID=A0A0U5CWK2_9EURY|nr:hypothetical protein [Halobacterium hubeiense]CQH50917.1 uncharacterized protein HHUB_1675 [Halobacterium hubeiense]
MPSTRTFVTVAVAAVVAVAVTLRRYVTLLVVELPIDVTPQLLTRATLGGRFAAFVLVYGLLFGVAYWAGTHASERDDATLAAATFAAAATTALAVSVGVVAFTGGSTQSIVFDVAAVVATSVATGVKLAVVAFAGVAAGGR